MQKQKLVLTVIFFLTVVASSFSQMRRYVNLELAGGYGLGVSYDSRLKENSAFGYKIGLGYGFEKQLEAGGKVMITPIGSLLDSYVENVVSLPVQFYYLLGKQNKHFETGLGICTYYADYYIENNGISYYCFIPAKYRYEAQDKRLLLSVGFDFIIKTPGSNIVGNPIRFYPSISIGWRL